MTPSARLQATLELLDRLGTSRMPMDATIGDYLRHRRYIGSKDRAAIVERTYQIVRAHARLGWWLEKAGTGDTPRCRALAWLILGEQDENAESLFDGSKYGPEPLAAAEKKLADFLKGKKLEDPAMPETVRAECPPQYEQALRAYFADDFMPEMTALQSGAPLDLRVNSWKADRQTVQKSLAKDGVKTDPAPYAPAGLRARDKAYLAKTKAFHKGWIAIQDEGSQLIAEICGAQPGMQVLDYCAGAGGKTLALAAAMRNKGRIVAMDTEKTRLEKARPRFKKAGLHDIIEVRPLAAEQSRKWLKRQKGKFDIVLADVPCTGTGTWRRNPDTRWRLFGPPLEELIQIQSEILDKIAKTVKPGGKLVYATCSLLPAENEEQIEAFLKNHDDFTLADHDLPYAKGPYMRLTPHRHNTDGFFAAVLIRK